MTFNPYVLNVSNPWDTRRSVIPTTPRAQAIPERMLIYPVNAPVPDVIDNTGYQTYPYPPTMEPQVAGLGSEAPLDLVGMMKDMYSGYLDMAPTIDFFGNHPIMTLTLIMAAIVAGGAVGGYIGAGYKASAKRR